MVLSASDIGTLGGVLVSIIYRQAACLEKHFYKEGRPLCAV